MINDSVNSTISEGEELGYDFRHESGSQSAASDAGDISDPGDVRKWFESFDSANILKDLDSLHFGDDDSDPEMDFVGDQEVVVKSCPYNEELALAALRDLPKLGAKRRLAKEETLRRLDEEDFEQGMPRLAFRIVKANVEALFVKKMKADQLRAAIQWVFGRTVGEWTFDSCCAVLGARKDVIRLRIHYEFWRRWYKFDDEFPFLIDPVPDAVADEIYFISGDEGSDLARAAWMKPGIESEELLHVASRGRGGAKYMNALDMLSDRYLMSQIGNCWYLTGRNPALRAQDLAMVPFKPQTHQVSWSRMF